MKPIILNINEMSESREVYDSKPNIFFAIFIYFVLGMLLVSLIWMYFGRIDVVVKSEAILRPNEQVSTVLNEYNGTIEQVNFEDGDTVKKGDVLYVINHSDLQTEMEYQEEQRKDTKETISLLQMYKKSIEEDTNYFEKSEKEETYYIQFENYYLNYQTMKKGSNDNSKELDLNINTSTDQLNRTNLRLDFCKSLKSSIEQGKNIFINSGEQRDYYNLYEKYVSDYETIGSQYDAKEKEIELSTAKEGLVNSLEYFNAQLTGYTVLKESIEKGQNYFLETDSYSLKYQEFVSKAAQLSDKYEQAKEEYDLNVLLKDYGVTAQEIKQSKTAMEQAYKAIDNYKVSYLAEVNGKITEVKKSIKDMDLQKDNTLSKAVLLKQNEKEKKAALKSYHLKYMVELDGKITELEDGVSGIQDNLESLTLQADKTFLYSEPKSKGKEKIVGSLVEYKNKELQSTITSLDAFKEKEKELDVKIEKVKKAIDSAVVTASVNGVVNTGMDLVEGDILAAGTNVLTVIPEGKNLYKANIYVSNADIGKIKKGMDIKCNVYALPNTEYGYLKGTVTKISKDIKVDSQNSAGYYLAEASLERRTLYDQSGKEANLKVGMSSQAQIITGNKRILIYLLEQLDFLK